jgi:integrase
MHYLRSVREMPRIRLTEAAVAKLKPTESKQVDYFDLGLPGLVLRISYGGTRSWRVLYYEKSKAKTYGIGRYPIIDLKTAREKARSFLENPQLALRRIVDHTFQAVVDDFLKRHVEANGLRSRVAIERCFDRYVLPHWKDRPISDIRRADVTALLDLIEDQNGPRQADMVLAILSKLFNWHQARTDDFNSPVVRGMKRTKPGDRKRKRILVDEELRVLWKVASVMSTFGAMARFALLTAQRREKIRSVRWTDIRDGVWIIHSEPREKSTAGSIKLPGEAIKIMEKLPQLVGNPFIFPASVGAGSFNSFSQRKLELDLLMRSEIPDMENWTFHDLRRTARSLMSRAGVRPEIAERVLGHAIQGVEGVYDRHNYDLEKADALVKLSGLLHTIISPPVNNVIPIHQNAVK